MQEKKFLVVSGGNLNLPEANKASIYGEGSLDDIHRQLNALAADLKVKVECVQCIREDEIVNCLQTASDAYAGVIINAGALAHCSHALRSAIREMQLPCVEVFTSNIHAHEEYHHQSVIASVCAGVIGGFGIKSYLLALQALVHSGEV